MITEYRSPLNMMLGPSLGNAADAAVTSSLRSTPTQGSSLGTLLDLIDSQRSMTIQGTSLGKSQGLSAASLFRDVSSATQLCACPKCNEKPTLHKDGDAWKVNCEKLDCQTPEVKNASLLQAVEDWNAAAREAYLPVNSPDTVASFRATATNTIRSVKDVIELLGIPADRRVEGMVVYVRSKATYCRLKPGPYTFGSWEDISPPPGTGFPVPDERPR